MSASETHRAIDAVWRIESAKPIAGIARIVRDVGVAEELAQDALVAALEQWDRPGPGPVAGGGSDPRPDRTVRSAPSAARLDRTGVVAEAGSRRS
jgi:hypothetical protein